MEPAVYALLAEENSASERGSDPGFEGRGGVPRSFVRSTRLVSFVCFAVFKACYLVKSTVPPQYSYSRINSFPQQLLVVTVPGSFEVV